MPTVTRVAWLPTTRLQISGQRFMRRRLERALLGGLREDSIEWESRHAAELVPAEVLAG